MSLPRIITTFVYPPIPIRTMDWQAHYDDDDDPTDGHQCATGHGRTEAEAVVDLIENHPRGYPDCDQIRRCDECVSFRTKFWREHDGSENSTGHCERFGRNVDDGSTCDQHSFEGERDQVRTLPHPVPWREPQEEILF